MRVVSSSLEQKRRDVVEDLCSFLVAVRYEYSQRVAADVHHQLQRRVSVFGCFTSRTALFVHFCLHHTKKIMAIIKSTSETKQNTSITCSSPVRFQAANHCVTQNEVRQETALIRCVPI